MPIDLSRDLHQAALVGARAGAVPCRCPLGSGGINRLCSLSRVHRLCDLPGSIDFAMGRGRLLQLLDMPCVTVLSLPPRRSVVTFRSAHATPCCLRPEGEGSASGFYFLSRPPVGSLALRPGDSLTIPRMALSVGFIRFVSSPDATQATGVPTLALVGLTPTEHASLSWTHSFAKTRYGSAG